MSRSPRLGILGGTFDPPHIGHLVAAINVREELGLDEIFMMVANVPWQKVGSRDISSAADRLAMVQAAADRVDHVSARDDEIRRGGDSYTADTLEALRAQFPDAELYVIVGSDVAALLDSWKHSEVVKDLATMVVYPRPPVGDLRPPAGWNYKEVDVPLLQISSTELRSRVRDGRPIDFLVPADVQRHIETNGLYL